MSDLTRRGFVTKSAGTAAALTSIGALVAQHAEADPADPTVPAGSEPVVAYVADPSTGKISVMTGNREVTVRDRKLAARIERAAR